MPGVKIIFEAVAGQGGVAGRAHVEVVRRSAGRGGDGFSAHDAEVAFVLVAEGAESGGHRGRVAAGGDDDVDVDDGLGGQPGHRGAARVLDALGQRAERGDRGSRTTPKTTRYLGFRYQEQDSRWLGTLPDC